MRIFTFLNDAKPNGGLFRSSFRQNLSAYRIARLPAPCPSPQQIVREMTYKPRAYYQILIYFCCMSIIHVYVKLSEIK